MKSIYTASVGIFSSACNIVIIVGMETLNPSDWSGWRPKTHPIGRSGDLKPTSMAEIPAKNQWGDFVIPFTFFERSDFGR